MIFAIKFANYANMEHTVDIGKFDREGTHEMNATGIVRQQPTFIEHEGYTYLELNGEFFKGCKRCGGEGHYSHNGEHSRCYECDNGAIAKLGEQLASKEAAEKWCHVRNLARLNRIRKAEEKRLIEVAKMEAKQAEVKAFYPGVFEFLMSLVFDNTIYGSNGEPIGYDENVKVEGSTFLRSMAENLTWVTAANKPFTDNMAKAVIKVMESRQEKAAAQAALPALVEGRRVITGKVISTKAIEGDYGTAYKMLVEEADGTRVFGSIASSLWNEVEFLGAYRKAAWNETDGVMTKLVGMEVTFTAKVEASSNDKSFGFFSRPTKAAIVA